MKIVLLCYAGMSTSMVMNKMKAAAAAEGLDLEVAAASVSDLDDYKEGANAVLLGPQIRFALDEVKEKVAGKIPVMAIDTRDYGMMRGDKILKDTIKAIEEFNKSSLD